MVIICISLRRQLRWLHLKFAMKGFKLVRQLAIVECTFATSLSTLVELKVGLAPTLRTLVYTSICSNVELKFAFYSIHTYTLRYI